MSDLKNNKELIKGIGVYAIGTFGTKILSFLIVPLYTYYIATDDMGVYDILTSTISLLTPIITMQISDAAYRWIIRDDIIDKEKYIRASLQIVGLNCTCTILIIICINRFYNIPYCLYFCLTLILSLLFHTVQKLLRGLKNQWLFAIAGLVYTTIFLGLNVIQLCFFKMGVESLLQSAMIANILAILLIWVLEPRLRINYFAKTDIKLVSELCRYSIPLIPNYLNWWVINSSDRYIVLYALGSSANGILAIAHKFPSMLQAILNLFNNSWQDLSVSDLKEDPGAYYTSVFRIYYRLALTSLLGLIPVTKIVIMLIMSDAYKSACDFVAFYYLGTVFQSFSSFYGVGYLRSKKTGKAFSTSVYGAIVNAVVNIAFVNLIGLQAASISTFCGFLIMWIIREKQNRKELKILVKWHEFWSLTAVAVLMSIASIYCNLFLNFVLFIIGCGIFIILNYQKLKQLIITLGMTRNR